VKETQETLYLIIIVAFV